MARVTIRSKSITLTCSVEHRRRLNEKEALGDVLAPADSEGTWDVDLTRSGYRVSTDAEWECAARAGTHLMHFFGAGDSRHLDMFMSVSRDGSYPAESYLPNRWGLFDVYGNVFELTLTKFDRERNPNVYQKENASPRTDIR